MKDARKIWVRGLTPSDRGKRIYCDELGSGQMISFEHFDKTTVVSLRRGPELNEWDLPHDFLVEVFDD